MSLTSSLFARWGAPSLVFAKFIPGFASLAMAMAGVTRISLLSFLMLDALGVAEWASVGLALGWTIGPAVN